MVVQPSRIAGKIRMAKLCTQGRFIQWLHVELNTADQFAFVKVFKWSIAFSLPRPCRSVVLALAGSLPTVTFSTPCGRAERVPSQEANVEGMVSLTSIDVLTLA